MDFKTIILSEQNLSSGLIGNTEVKQDDFFNALMFQPSFYFK